MKGKAGNVLRLSLPLRRSHRFLRPDGYHLSYPARVDMGELSNKRWGDWRDWNEIGN